MSNDKIKITIGILTLIALMFGANNTQENNTEKPTEKPIINNCCELTLEEIQKINAKLEIGIIPEITDNNRGYIREFFNKLINGLYQNVPSTLIVAAILRTSPWIFKGIKKISLPFMDYILNNNDTNDKINEDINNNSSVKDTFPKKNSVTEPPKNNDTEPPKNNDDKGKEEKDESIHYINEKDAYNNLMQDTSNKVPIFMSKKGVYTLTNFLNTASDTISNLYNKKLEVGQQSGYNVNIPEIIEIDNDIENDTEKIYLINDIFEYEELLNELEIIANPTNDDMIIKYNEYILRIKAFIITFYKSLMRGNFIDSYSSLNKQMGPLITHIINYINSQSKLLGAKFIQLYDKLQIIIEKYKNFRLNYYENLENFISLFVSDDNLNILRQNLFEQRDGIFNIKELETLKKLMDELHDSVTFQYSYVYFFNLYQDLKRTYGDKPNDKQQKILNSLGKLVNRLEVNKDLIDHINVFLNISNNNFNDIFIDMVKKIKSIIKECILLYNNSQIYSLQKTNLRFNDRTQLNKKFNEIFKLINIKLINSFLKFLKNKENYVIIKDLFNMKQI